MNKPDSQHGVALVVALIFLVILTVLGIAALGNNTLQTRMTYGAGDANLAFQTAETALASGETWLSTQTIQPDPSCASYDATAKKFTSVSKCGQSASTSAFIWPRRQDGTVTPPVGNTQVFDESWWLDNGRKYGWTYIDNITPAKVDANQPIENVVADTPRYVIEELGPDITGSLVVGQGRTYRIYNYQVTARAFGAQPATRQVVQSTFGQGY